MAISFGKDLIFLCGFVIGKFAIPEQTVTMLPTNFHVDTVEGVCKGFLPYTRFLGFLEFSGYHQWQQESQ